MTGYVRKDTTNNIADGNVINSADLDNEFDGLRDAFNSSTGHVHDGTTGNGAPILVFGPTQDVVVSASAITPKTTNTVDIGSGSLKFKDLYMAGNASIGGTLAITGVATLTAQPILSSLTASSAVATDASKGLISVTNTGTGNNVLSASPTLTGTIAGASLSLSSLTSGRVSYSTTAGLQTDSANLTFNGTTLTANTLALTNALATTNGGTGLTSFTANGVVYASSTSALATGSALTFDGVTFQVTGASVASGTVKSFSGFLTDGSSLTANVSERSFSIGETQSFGALSLNISATKGGDPIVGPEIIRFSSANIISYIGGSEQMRLTSTGLGIGTSSPLTGLTLSKSGTQWTNNSSNSYPVPAGRTFLQMEAQASQANWFGFTGSYGATSGSANLLLQVNLNNTNQQAGNYIGSEATSAASADLTFGRMIGGATTGSNSTKSEQMRLDSSGNLGIGTSSPFLSLSVNKASDTTFTNLPANILSYDTTAMAAGVGGGIWFGGKFTSGNDSQTVFAGISGIKENGTSASTAGTLVFGVRDSGGGVNIERMRITSAGNLGLGVTPSAWGSTYKAVQVGLGGSLAARTNAQSQTILGANWYADSGNKYIGNGAASQYQQDAGIHYWYTAPSGTAGDAISFTQAMSLTTSGALLLGATSFTGAENSSSVQMGAGANTATVWVNHITGATTGSRYVNFAYAGTEIGSITQNGTTGVLYNIMSDYRLKTIIGPVADAGQRIDALQPVEYTWNASGERTRGFLAHQFQEVYAGSVSGTKDAVDAEGKPVYQSMQASTSEVIADLVAEIQSLRQRLAAAGI